MVTFFIRVREEKKLKKKNYFLHFPPLTKLFSRMFFHTLIFWKRKKKSKNILTKFIFIIYSWSLISRSHKMFFPFRFAERFEKYGNFLLLCVERFYRNFKGGLWENLICNENRFFSRFSFSENWRNWVTMNFSERCFHKKKTFDRQFWEWHLLL